LVPVTVEGFMSHQFVIATFNALRILNLTLLLVQYIVADRLPFSTRTSLYPTYEMDKLVETES